MENFRRGFSSTFSHLKFWLLGLFLFIGVLISPLSANAEDAEDVSDTETEGVLRIGMEADSAPFNWSQINDENGAVEISNSQNEYVNGYDVQMSKKIADELGLELEIVKVEWDGLPPALMSGKIDAIVAGMSPTGERKNKLILQMNITLQMSFW